MSYAAKTHKGGKLAFRFKQVVYTIKLTGIQSSNALVYIFYFHGSFGDVILYGSWHFSFHTAQNTAHSLRVSFYHFLPIQQQHLIAEVNGAHASVILEKLKT